MYLSVEPQYVSINTCRQYPLELTNLPVPLTAAVAPSPHAAPDDAWDAAEGIVGTVATGHPRTIGTTLLSLARWRAFSQ